MSLASEAKLAVLYCGCKLAVPICPTLKVMGHSQLICTMVTTNNSTTQGLTMGTLTPKASKSMDQHFHWFKCHNAQCQFLYLWHQQPCKLCKQTSSLKALPSSPSFLHPRYPATSMNIILPLLNLHVSSQSIPRSYDVSLLIDTQVKHVLVRVC